MFDFEINWIDPIDYDDRTHNGHELTECEFKIILDYKTITYNRLKYKKEIKSYMITELYSLTKFIAFEYFNLLYHNGKQRPIKDDEIPIYNSGIIPGSIDGYIYPELKFKRNGYWITITYTPRNWKYSPLIFLSKSFEITVHYTEVESFLKNLINQVYIRLKITLDQDDVEFDEFEYFVHIINNSTQEELQKYKDIAIQQRNPFLEL